MKRNFLIHIFTFLLLSAAFTANSQSITVSGLVRDKNTSEPLIGANMVEVDKNGRFLNGTITDLNGNYIIKVSSGSATLQVSLIGFEKQIIQVNNRAKIDVTLEETTSQLSEITIVGQKMGNDGVVAIRDRGTAISRIELKEMHSSMTTSVEEMLQGRMGNVDITAISGDPGAGLNIRIRGTATLNAKNSPLIVINGIPYDTQIDESFDLGSADVEKFGSLIDVAPENIESIEVLKDAGATAIWGSKASNGVIMIKTKRGTHSKPIFEYQAKFTTSHEPEAIPMLDGGGYAKLIAEEHFNLDSRNDFIQTNPDANQIAYNKDWEEYWNFAQNTNWIDEITKVAFTQQHNFSVRGGGEKSGYNVSTNYLDEQGTTIGTRLKKLNIGTAFDYTISSKLKFQTDVMYTRYDQDATYDYEDWYYKDSRSLRSLAYRKMPNLSVYVRDTNNVVYDEFFTPEYTLQGSATEIPNPVAFAKAAKHKRYKDNFRAGFTLNYQISDKLTANSIITLDVFDSKMEKYLPYNAIGAFYYSGNTRMATNEFTNKSSIYNMTKLIYNPISTKDHELTFLGQFDAELTKSKGYYVITSFSYSEDNPTTIGNESPPSYEDASLSEYRSIGYYGNVFYKLKDKYILSGGVKVEGNSKYSREARWGLFPAGSVAWRISEEPFMKSIKFIDDMKIRGSWGISGNSPDDNYLYYNEYVAGPEYDYLGTGGIVPSNMELTGLKWENIEQYNIGFSFFGIKNRLNVEFDIYDKTTHNLFLKNTNIPSSTGFSTYNTNDGSLKNKGIELSIDYKIIDKEDFNLSFNFNVAHNKNVVVELPQNFSQETGDMNSNGEYFTTVTPGEAIGGFFGYNFLGVYKNMEDTYVKDADGNLVYELGEETPMVMIFGADGYDFRPGDSKYEDVNHDGKIDKLDIKYLGDTNPKLMGGFGPRVRYKNFTFNMFIYYRIGSEIINQTRMDTEKMYGYDNQSTATNWRWRTEGQETDMPRALYGEGYNWLGSTRFVEDGSFVRLKSASITYDLPKEWIKKFNIKDCKMYITGYNLYTWTNYSGQDPEVGLPNRPDELPKDYSRTPPSTRYTLGLSLTF
jgi:TonB-linked SusC/RagA family outer membrane protein